jgi:hypothetical protein
MRAKLPIRDRKKEELDGAVQHLEQAADRLVGLLWAYDHDVRFQAGCELRRHGALGVARLARALDQADGPARRMALIRQLGLTGGSDPRTALAALGRVPGVVAGSPLGEEYEDAVGRLRPYLERGEGEAW